MALQLRVVSLLVVPVLGIALAATALAATADPQRLIVRPSDLPADFRLNERYHGYESNDRFVRGRPAYRRVVARSKRLTGYYALYEKQVPLALPAVNTNVSLFRTTDGARYFLNWLDRQQRRDNAERVGKEPVWGRKRLRLGDESWAYWAGPPNFYVLVFWRHGRTITLLHSWRLGLQRALELARAQERRIASVLH